ncbi:hypothetical protein GCM10010470_01500 [Saccharopolyspora taberi]|uniref:AAA+ ATPase domain-containing protein n=1 Tax=Saccharopolyspora taberi TaxID=60895 RepID=A0ABN3V199_9PSEU
MLRNDEALKAFPRVLALLAVLALSPAKPVARDKINFYLTGDPNGLSATTLRGYAHALRECVGKGRISNPHQGALQLDVPLDKIDYWTFKDLLAQAGSGDLATRIETLRQARDLWTDAAEPLAGLGDVHFQYQVAEMQRLRREMYRDLVAAEAKHGEVAEALADARQACWLVGDDDGHFSSTIEELKKRSRVTREPARLQLLRSSRPIIFGRDQELERLDAWLVPDAELVRVVTVTGPPGVGKTELATTAARRAQSRFADGVLYVDLNGFSDDQQESIDDVRLSVLGSLDVRVNGQLAKDVASAYLSELAARSVLIIFDNAVNSAHVWDLLPGGAGSVVLVTSRSRLVELAVSKSVDHLELGPLDPEASMQLLADAIGDDRARNEKDAAERLLTAFGGIPLLLIIAAAQARRHPQARLESLLEEWKKEQTLLKLDVPGNRRLELRTVLSWSYGKLSKNAQQLFGLIGVHPLPVIRFEALTHMSGVASTQVRTGVAELVDANLLNVVDGHHDRYRAHDLINAYAAEIAAQWPASEQDAARKRLLEYLAHAGRACDLAMGSERELPLGPSPDTLPLPKPTTSSAARSWFDAEYPVYVAVLNDENFWKWQEYRWLLPLTLVTFQWRRGYWDEAVRFLLVARDLLRDVTTSNWGQDEQRLLIMTYRMLGGTYRLRREYPLAEGALRQSVATSVKAGDRHGEALGLQSLGVVHEEQGNWAEARKEFPRTAELFGLLSDRRGQSHALNGVASVFLADGSPHEALEKALEARSLASRETDPNGWAAIHRNLARCHAELGEDTAAVDYYRSAIEVYVEQGATIKEARGYFTIGKWLRRSGNLADERRCLERFCELCDNQRNLSEVDRERMKKARARLTQIRTR